MGCAEISYKQTSKSAAELRQGNKKNVDLDRGFVRMVTCQNWISFGRHNSCGENLPWRYFLFTSFLHYIMRQRLTSGFLANTQLGSGNASVTLLTWLPIQTRLSWMHQCDISKLGRPRQQTTRRRLPKKKPIKCRSGWDTIWRISRQTRHFNPSLMFTELSIHCVKTLEFTTAAPPPSSRPLSLSLVAARYVMKSDILPDNK